MLLIITLFIMALFGTFVFNVKINDKVCSIGIKKFLICFIFELILLFILFIFISFLTLISSFIIIPISIYIIVFLIKLL